MQPGSLERSAQYMLSVYEAAGDMLLEGFDAGERVAFTPEGLLGFCGMGTSGFACEISSMALGPAARIVGTSRYWEPPSSLRRGDSLIAVSYSGNTAETIECASKALERGLKVSAVTSGGRLAELLKGAGAPIALIRGGMPQRTTLPLMVGAVLGLLSEALGGLGGVVKDASRVLRRSPPSWVDDVASLIASSEFVVVAACGPLEVVARRWRTELAENSKMVVKSESYPESGHNDLVAFQSKAPHGLAAIIIEGPGPERCRHILRAVREIYADSGAETVSIAVDAQEVFAAVLRGAQLAGIVSVKAAVKRGVDPLATPILERYRSLQARLSRT